MSEQGRYSVVVVEDESLLLRYIVKKVHAASERFLVVDTASDGLQGLKSIETHLPDLVITDIQMPQLSGLDLAEIIHRRYPDVLTIILTGYANFEYAKQGIISGVFDYLLKPLNFETLQMCLDRAALQLDSRHWRPENENREGISSKEIFETIRLYLRENYACQIDLHDLSDRFGYSPAYLTKIFKKYADCTPIRYLTDLRVRAACQMLSNTNLSVSDIGIRVGYPDPFYFSRVFKRYKNISPLSFRTISHGGVISDDQTEENI